ncbi:hypothetical protein [Salipiger thiooxidans]|uniref:hypothetical protein n=1 Tax=Salipiger thiooxidans TaxID=282683 RepID=UPI001CD722FE|nr:hypothetical protein [Salipiger thiooxidans]MCA0846092.1 hypothetical protein [Salipiger thiooxidans]
MGRPTILPNITRDDLAPVWACRSISVERIAETLGVSRQVVGARAKALGLEPRRKAARMKRNPDDKLFIAMWDAGVDRAAMVRTFGYTSRSSLYGRAERLGLEAPRHGRRITLAQFREQEIARRMSAQAGGKIRAAGGEDRSQMWTNRQPKGV